MFFWFYSHTFQTMCHFIAVPPEMLSTQLSTPCDYLAACYAIQGLLGNFSRSLMENLLKGSSNSSSGSQSCDLEVSTQNTVRQLREDTTVFCSSSFSVKCTPVYRQPLSNCIWSCREVKVWLQRMYKSLQMYKVSSRD